MAQCRVGIRLSDHELKWLDSLPFPAHVIKPAGQCALELGHVGPHFALGQENPEGEHWVRWVENESRIVLLKPCPSQGAARSCLLFSGHDGRHDYAFD